MTAFYNEIDPFAAAWLRELIAANLIAPGVVDERSILDLKPGDLAGYDQVHLFAGIAGWSFALRLAGVPDDEPIWTGSAPCQPFSSAGKRKGVRDSRDLWPAFRDLIAECRPPALFGEQVASADGRLWLARVRTDLEGMGYRVGASDLCSAGVGAPNIRQRIYWMAHAKHAERRPELEINRDASRRNGFGRRGHIGRLADPDGVEPRDGHLQRGGEHGQRQEDGGVGGMGDTTGARHIRKIEGPEGDPWEEARVRLPSEGCGIDRAEPSRASSPQRMGDAIREGLQERISDRGVQPQTLGPQQRQTFERGGNFGHWSRFSLIPCTDGKSRRVEPGVEPLVARLPRGVVPSGDPSVEEAQGSAEARIGRLRGYGNAINPYVASEFIAASREAIAMIMEIDTPNTSDKSYDPSDPRTL